MLYSMSYTNWNIRTEDKEKHHTIFLTWNITLWLSTIKDYAM
jgi:hypothetical protein